MSGLLWSFLVSSTSKYEKYYTQPLHKFAPFHNLTHVIDTVFSITSWLPSAQLKLLRSFVFQLNFFEQLTGSLACWCDCCYLPQNFPHHFPPKCFFFIKFTHSNFISDWLAYGNIPWIFKFSQQKKKWKSEGLDLLNNNADMHATCHCKLFSTVRKVIR